MSSAGHRSRSARTTVRPPRPESNTPSGAEARPPFSLESTLTPGAYSEQARAPQLRSPTAAPASLTHPHEPDAAAGQLLSPTGRQLTPASREKSSDSRFICATARASASLGLSPAAIGSRTSK